MSDDGTQAQRGEETCMRSHSQEAAKLGFKPGWPSLALTWHVRLETISLGEARHPRLFPDKAESCDDAAERPMAVGLIFHPAVPKADLDTWEPRVVVLVC